MFAYNVSIKIYNAKIFCKNNLKYFKMSQIGSNIKKLRKVKGLSQLAFADLFNLTRGNISSYEELRAEPKVEVILQIAKYFSIPVGELLEKQLTVNEILNFEDYFKDAQQIYNTGAFKSIPFLGRDAFLKEAIDFQDLDSFPKIYFPIFNKHKLIAIENMHDVPRTLDFPVGEHVILFFEQVEIDNLHTLNTHFGFYYSEEDFFFGQFDVNGKEIQLVLNDWKSVTFSQETSGRFWKLYGKYDYII